MNSSSIFIHYSVFFPTKAMPADLLTGGLILGKYYTWRQTQHVRQRQLLRIFYNKFRKRAALGYKSPFEFVQWEIQQKQRQLKLAA